MIPVAYNLKIFQGDTFLIPSIVLPDLTPFGGPADLTGTVITAQLRRGAGIAPLDAVDLLVEIVNPTTREIRLSLSATQTAPLAGSGVWDLQVAHGEWRGTPLAGTFTASRQSTL